MFNIGRTNTINAPAPLEAVIFDFDDTLISWEKFDGNWPEMMRPALTHVRSALTEQGIDIPLDDFLQTFGQEMRSAWARAHETCAGVSFGGELFNTLNALGYDGTAVNIDALLRSANTDWHVFETVTPFPDVHDVLDGIRARGLKTGLITNAWQPMWMRDRELEAHGLIERLDARITSGDTGYIKPHPAIFWRMCGLLDTVPERAIMVGDTPKADIRGGNAVGMMTVQMKPPHLESNERKEAKTAAETPDHIITTLTELLPIVEERINNQ